MKKSTFATTAFLISGLFIGSALITSCASKKEHAEEEHQGAKADSVQHEGAKMDSTQTLYACPMHIEVKGKEGDKCPKCGMKLEAVNNKDEDTE